MKGGRDREGKGRRKRRRTLKSWWRRRMRRLKKWWRIKLKDIYYSNILLKHRPQTRFCECCSQRLYLPKHKEPRQPIPNVAFQKCVIPNGSQDMRLTGIQVFVAAPQQVGELLAAFALAVAPGGVEAQLLHQDQRLLTHVFIPVPRHPPICIALRTSSLSQWRRRRPHRPRLSDCDRPPHARGLPLVRKGVGARREGARCLDHGDQVPMYERTTSRRRWTVPAGSRRGSGRK